MTAILTFALVAPIASFGAIAVGERRSGWDRPARSAVLGLVGACLGIERNDDKAQAALAGQYGLALLCHAPGRLLADYHTAQVPSAKGKRRHATRASELREPELNTILSRRDYRVGAWHLAALWSRTAAPLWSLENIVEAMLNPTFVPYLGRKACPLGLPLAPCIHADASDVVTALQTRHREGPESKFRHESIRGTAGDELTVVLDAAAMPGVLADAAYSDARHRVELRRDQPRSRRRWQFDLRKELVLEVSSK